jgi:hypothetical protein
MRERLADTSPRSVSVETVTQTVEGSFPDRRLRLGAVIAVAVAAAFLVWLLFIKGDGDNDRSPAKGENAVSAASVEDLKALPASIGHDVYWVGTKPGYTYELTRTKRGDIYIRYLPPGVQVGDQRPNFLTVGTYPHPHAFATVKKASRRQGAISRRIAGGGRSVTNRAIPKSVYFAYPGSDYLQEVYARSPKRARSLVSSGAVRPIR